MAVIVVKQRANRKQQKRQCGSNHKNAAPRSIGLKCISVAPAPHTVPTLRPPARYLCHALDPAFLR